jgi:hypothetical protein
VTLRVGVGSTEPLPAGRVLAYLVGVAALAFCITLLWFGMRAVMDLGGACASGGPYVPRVECPDAVIATTPLSIFGAFGAIGLMLWGGAALGGGWLGLVFLAWPALFLSLGWNFLEFGFSAPDGGWVWSWLVCGVLFVLMGAVPLIAVIGAFRAGDGDGRAYVGGRVHVRPGGGSGGTGDTIVRVRDDRVPPAGEADPVAVRLERLTDLRRRGQLTETEYAAARAATLADAAEAAR